MLKIVIGAILLVQAAAVAAEQAGSPKLPVPPPPPSKYPATRPPPIVQTRVEPTPPQPRGNVGIWVTEQDYPDKSPWLGTPQGEVIYRVLVGTDGRVQECHITKSSQVAVLDETTCKLVTRRGRFTPATDEYGRAIVGSWEGKVRWTIPADRSIRLPKSPESGKTIITYTIDPDGTAHDCKIESGPDPRKFMLWAMPCDFNQISPLQHDRQFQPVGRKVRMILDLKVQVEPASTGN